MNRFTRILVTPALFAATAALAQAPEYEAPRYPGNNPVDNGVPYQAMALPQQELDQILAPIALYPDSLLSQLLMASTYPQDVAQAAAWSRANSGLQGDEAVRAVENEPWHPSVKSLVAFPEVLKAMGEQPQWVQRLGDAFLAQEAGVMQTVQQLRRRADEAGNLQTNEQITVERSGADYVLAPPSPETVYVPYYDPRVVYGNWWWPSYQPIWWRPWAGYAYYGGWGWGPGVYVRSGFFYGGFNWRNRYVHYASHRPYYWGNSHYGRNWHDDRRNGRNGSWGNGGGYNGRGGSYDGRGGGYDGRGNGGRQNVQNGAPRAPQRPDYNGGERPRYVGGETAGPRPGIEGSATRATAGVRTVAPRYNMDGRVGGTGYRSRGGELRVEQPATAQQPVNVQRGFVPGERVGAAPGAAPRSQSKPLMAQPAPRVAPPAPRVAQPQQAIAQSRPAPAQPVQRGESQGRGAPTQRTAGPSPRANHEGNRGNRGNDGGGRGRGHER